MNSNYPEREAQRFDKKGAGAYYTPDPVVSSLVTWAVRNPDDRLLDPSCGDGRFIARHRNTVGIEQDAGAIRDAIARAPWALVHEGDFFSWASKTTDRFECSAGNPPFIRYQRFKDVIRTRALSLCTQLGVNFSGLTSSWAPFIVAAAGLLKPGGRMAFVVPAEIGHAPYAAPVLDYLAANFAVVHVIAVRAKLFPDLSEDCWLLYADAKGGRSSELRFTALDRFTASPEPPKKYLRVSVEEWRSSWKRRLRPYLMAAEARDLYRHVVRREDTRNLGQLASIGIGYVSGANEFFHLRPSQARRWRIPGALLQPSVRNGRALPPSRLTMSVVERWVRNDDPILLLRLPKSKTIPNAVEKYLRTDAARLAREAYKCRVREPWYSVPDVQIPEFFLSYMSGVRPALVRNDAKCTCTNSVHSVRIKRDMGALAYLRAWGTPFVQLSCELEGHPLGGGMLKLEPREATQIILPASAASRRLNLGIIEDATETLRLWRHYAPTT
jgi:adenine-specific DNA-methyltransferase